VILALRWSTEHLLLGIVNTEPNSATDVLAGVGVSADAVQPALLAVIRPKMI
jgi:hypothetical protein